MVENRITDGKRIAQLLASELTGLQVGGLEDVSVTDADSDAMPTETGTLAYRVTAGETELASVSLYPEYAEVEFTVETPDSDTFSETGTGEYATRQVTSGAAVKDAVDLIRETAEKHL